LKVLTEPLPACAYCLRAAELGSN